jgi:ribosome-associated toxin RatA of RatAB toxin-antitoxin module
MTAPMDLGPMPTRRPMRTVDERLVHAECDRLFRLVADVEQWPTHLTHYRSVVLRDRRSDGGGVVRMKANRPFGPVRWPVWWEAQMQVVDEAGQPRAIRFRHIDGMTRGMEVEWSFTPSGAVLAPDSAPVATFVRIVHEWDGPTWPLIGRAAAVAIIGPVFVHGIASRTLAGLGTAAERARSANAGQLSNGKRSSSLGTNVGARG